MHGQRAHLQVHLSHLHLMLRGQQLLDQAGQAHSTLAAAPAAARPAGVDDGRERRCRWCQVLLAVL